MEAKLLSQNISVSSPVRAGCHIIEEEGAGLESCGNPEDHTSSTELSFAVVPREIAMSNEVKLSREECGLGKSGQISQWGERVDMSVGRK